MCSCLYWSRYRSRIYFDEAPSRMFALLSACDVEEVRDQNLGGLDIRQDIELLIVKDRFAKDLSQALNLRNSPAFGRPLVIHLTWTFSGKRHQRSEYVIPHSSLSMPRTNFIASSSEAFSQVYPLAGYMTTLFFLSLDFTVRRWSASAITLTLRITLVPPI